MDGSISRTKTEVGGAHTLEADYVPVAVRLKCRISAKSNVPMLIDIHDDGTSIFNDKAALTPDQTEKKWTTIPVNPLRKDSIITCNIDQIFDIGTCRDLTVELFLQES
jgi:hypothetical protein